MATKKLLVPLDDSAFSRQILPVIPRMVRPDDYGVTLLRVADEPVGVFAKPAAYVPYDHSVLMLPRSSMDAELLAHPIYQIQNEDSVRAALEDELHPDMYYLQAAGFKVAIETRFGDPAAEILASVREGHIDLVAMATHGRTGVQRLVLGSIAATVLQHIAVPVLLIRPQVDPPAAMPA